MFNPESYINENDYNVSLKIQTTPALYSLSMRCLLSHTKRWDAAQAMLDMIGDCDDGLTYNRPNILRAMVDITTELKMQSIYQAH